MDPILIVGIIVVYFLMLFTISRFTGRKANNQTFFTGDKKSPWYLVAFGMIGASLSGVTFISIPGAVNSGAFGYMQIVLGYWVGYMVIAFVLMPLYYRLNLTSIYTYLKQRFGVVSYKTGASFFLLSRILGASFRLFLVADILQSFIFEAWGVPFAVTVALSILLIWLYTFKGGIRTLIFTDTLQTLFMLTAVGMSIWFIKDDLGWSMGQLWKNVMDSGYSQILFTDHYNSAKFFPKQFLAGMFIAICMTGLDQDMMQKNLSCAHLKDAQKNMISFSVVLVFVNAVFLVLGALLYIYADTHALHLPEKADQVYAFIALKGNLGIPLGIAFMLGLVAAAYSSADSALTSLTTSFCVDVLNIEKMKEQQQERTRKWVHVGMSVVLLMVIIMFKYVLQQSVIDELLLVAAFTYGPLLGLYFTGIFTKIAPLDAGVPVVCILAPALTFLLQHYSPEWWGGYEFGLEIIIINGALTFLGLYVLALLNRRQSIPVQVKKLGKFS